MRTQLYYGPHLHHVIACLNAGRADNAASWMERDIGEYPGRGPGDYPAPESLRIVDAPEWFEPKSTWPRMVEYVAAKDVPANCVGEGI